MNIRFLDKEEYHRLGDIEGLNGDNSVVCVAEEDGKIIGRLAIVMLPHLEALSVDPDVSQYCRGVAAYRMERTCTDKLRELGAKHVLAFAIDDKIEGYLKRLHYRKFATAWTKEI